MTKRSHISRGMDEVFKASPTRRGGQLLDELFKQDGQTLYRARGAAAEMTRFGVMKHLKVLEEAHLVTTQRAWPREAALPEPRPDPARPRPVGEQVRSSRGRPRSRASRSDWRTRMEKHEGGVALAPGDTTAVFEIYIKTTPETALGGDHRPGPAEPVHVRRAHRVRLERGLHVRVVRPRTVASTSPRARTSRSIRHAGSCRA